VLLSGEEFDAVVVMGFLILTSNGIMHFISVAFLSVQKKKDNLFVSKQSALHL
jgi:hypothetical protein